MPAVDPNILAAMAAYQTAPSLPSADPDILKQQGSYLTQLSKGGNAGTDLDTLLMTGQLQPGAFDPMTTLNPVDAPGYRLLQSYKQGTPLQRYIATMWEQGNKSSMEILADIQKMVADPQGDPNAQAVIDSLPRASVPITDPVTHQTTGYQQLEVPDMNILRDSLQQFETTVLSDPEFTVGPDGQPVSATTEDSAAMKAWHDAGFVGDPTAAYDPYDIAPAGTREADAATAQRNTSATDALTKARSDSTTADKAMRQARLAQEQWLNHQPGTSTPADQGSTDTRDWAGQAPITKAWWEAQDAAGSALDALGGGVGGAVNGLNSAGNAVAGLFRKPGAQDDQAAQLAAMSPEDRRNLPGWLGGSGPSWGERLGSGMTHFLEDSDAQAQSGRLVTPSQQQPGSTDAQARWLASLSPEESRSLPSWLGGQGQPWGEIAGGTMTNFLEGNDVNSHAGHRNTLQPNFDLPLGGAPTGTTAAVNPWIQRALGAAATSPTGGQGAGAGWFQNATQPDTGNPSFMQRATGDQRSAQQMRSQTAEDLDKARKARMQSSNQARKARQTQADASDAAFVAAHNQAIRQAMVQQMAAAGLTPGRAQVNARNAMIYGG